MKIASQRVAIVGVGLIGGSLALAGKRAGAFAHVVGAGRSQANLDLALRTGIIDEAHTDVARAVRGADLVVLAAPADACVELLTAVAAAAGPACVLTDVASVKAPICSEAVRLGVGSRFVGAHPIAGGTATGAAAADASLFVGRTVVVTPGVAERAPRDTVARMWRAVGAEVLDLDADAHDGVVAVSSHLPQLLASSLCALVGGDQRQALFLRLCGAGFRDTTRIAAGDAAMWTAIARENRRHLLDAVDRFAELWARVRDALARGDDAEVRALIEEGAAMRRRLGA
jgi:prephenate dehydrogenase